MAGERKGKTYEALTMVALRELKRQKKIKGEIFWNQTPEGITIEPDLTIGKDPNHPEKVILVTHSGSSKNSNMKFWRNMGELVEVKTFLPKIPAVYTITFDSLIYENLKKLQTAAFDGQLIVGDQNYGSELQRWVDDNHEDLPTPGPDKVVAIEGMIPGDKVLNGLLGRLIKDLEKVLSTFRPELDKIWQKERERSSGRAPQEKKTFVRRGLSKLLIFEDPELAMRLNSGVRVKASELPTYTYELGLAKKVIGRAVPGDEEVQDAVCLLGKDRVVEVLKEAPVTEISGWLLTLRNVSHLRFMGDYVISEYEELCNPEILSGRLQKLHDDPEALLDPGEAPENWPPKTVWLLEYLIELIKESSGAANGYGYAQLAKDVISNGWGVITDLSDAGQFGGGFGLSAWIARKEESTFRDDLVLGVAKVISNKLKVLSKKEVTRLIIKLPENISKNILEAKLCTYKGFEPLLSLIKTAVPDCSVVSIRTAYAEKAGLGGQVGKTRLVKVKNTLINWQSVSDAGRDHKKKELCGRAVALRYSWDAEAKKFILRPGVKKLILVVDGTWRQSDLDALARAGWDEIFYPNEMESLAKAIV